METTATVQKREKTNLEQAILVDWYQQTLCRFLGSQESVDAFTAEIFTQARRSPKLYICTIDSARFIIARVASLKLNPAIPNEVSMIPRSMKQANGKYVDEMTVIYGYAGLRKMAMRSSEVKDVLTAAVCANDTWKPSNNDVSLPVHRLPGGFTPRGRVIGYYAAAQLHNGNWRTWPMSVSEVEAHAKRYVKDLERAPAWSRGTRPDVEDGLTPFDKMGLKTCLRMLLNGRDIPLSTEVYEALESEEVALHIETPAERQGYDRNGQRPQPALTEGNGQTLEDLLGDLDGGHDEVQVELARQRQPVEVTIHKAAEKVLTVEEQDHNTLWRQILKANMQLVHAGDLRDECLRALKDAGFSDVRGNELANWAADMADSE